MGLIPENSMVKIGLKGAIAVGMVGAMVLPLYTLYVLNHGGTVAPMMNTLAIIACVALVAHLIEGVVAGAIAYRRGDSAFNAGVHAFFTGFVGLTETIKGK